MAERRIQAIIFDLDGVLVDAKGWHFEAFNHALADFGHTPISLDEHLERYDGLPTLRKLALLSSRQAIPSSQFAAIAESKQYYTIRFIEEKCAPLQHHIDLLEQLKKKGFRMAVCSNSVRSSVNLLLEKATLMPYFEFTLSNEDVKNSKPDPEIYLRALEKLHIGAGEALVLEDNINGIRAARASGAHVSVINSVNDVRIENVFKTLAHIEGGPHGA